MLTVTSVLFRFIALIPQKKLPCQQKIVNLFKLEQKHDFKGNFPFRHKNRRMCKVMGDIKTWFNLKLYQATICKPNQSSILPSWFVRQSIWMLLKMSRCWNVNGSGRLKLMFRHSAVVADVFDFDPDRNYVEWKFRSWKPFDYAILHLLLILFHHMT